MTAKQEVETHIEKMRPFGIDYRTEALLRELAQRLDENAVCHSETP